MGNSWTARQRRDPFVAAAKRGGFRARAVFKLEEIDRKYRLIKPHSKIVDLGAAPGSWSQYAAKHSRAPVIAVDKLAMAPIENVHFIRGDFSDAAVAAQIFAALNGAPDLVLSDVAPNISGISDIDQARIAQLQGAVLAFCRRTMRPGAMLLTKLFEGESAADIRRQLAECFTQVRVVKPAASRAQSREIYLLGDGFLSAQPSAK